MQGTTSTPEPDDGRGRPGIAARCTAVADSAALLGYVETLDHGLILVGRDGRVAHLSRETRRLLGRLGAAPRFSLRHLARSLRVPGGDGRRRLSPTVLRALRRRESASFQAAPGPNTLCFDLTPLPDGCWAIRVEDAARRAAARHAAASGSEDPLTGLDNRSAFARRLDEARARLARTGEAFAVHAVDLDRFKHVNDTLGRGVGDALLRIVAQRLRSVVREIDGVARLGGDEFAVLQAGVADPGDVAALARRIVDLLGRTYVVEGHLVAIGASVGVAVPRPDGTGCEHLLRHADLALYRAKTDGRDTFRFFEPAMDERLRARRDLEIDLRKALALRQFELHYQPQMNIATGRIVGCEALIRWRHPARGMVSPVEFIPLAEETGLIVPIGEWVLRTACDEAMRWPGELSVAVNVSPSQFRGGKLADLVASALHGSGLVPHRLELEITEGVLLQESDANIATLHALRDLGLRIAMDDFGTGYSSLNYLRAFPFDRIKIDRAFIADLSSKPDSIAIVRAIAGLAASFGMLTVAEGVETAEQMRRIRAEGCTDAQGYLVGRPMPARETLELLACHAASLSRLADAIR